jgi:hypothetical protein
MPLKSWEFVHNGTTIRAEIWWRFSFWSRKMLFINHRLVIHRRGRFTAGLPLESEFMDSNGVKHALRVQFEPKRFLLDVDCRCVVDSTVVDWREVPVQVEYKRRHSAENDGVDYYISNNQFVGCLIIFPLLFLMVFLAAPMSAVGSVLQARAERRLRAALAKRGRYLPWSQIEAKMRSGNATCTLIVQLANMTPPRAWWSEDDLMTIAPLDRPNPERMTHPSASHQIHPYVDWCWYRYLSEETGTAILTELPKAILERLGFSAKEHDPQCCRSLYPTLNVIIVGYTRGKREKAAPQFVNLLGKSLADSIPALVGGLEHTDATVREMCREAIRMAGPQAAEAIPLLTRQFRLGPWNERQKAASTLVALGPDGEAVLKSAVALDDPCLRQPAIPVLHMHERLGKSVYKREPVDGSSRKPQSQTDQLPPGQH